MSENNDAIPASDRSRWQRFAQKRRDDIAARAHREGIRDLIAAAIERERHNPLNRRLKG